MLQYTREREKTLCYFIDLKLQLTRVCEETPKSRRCLRLKMLLQLARARGKTLRYIREKSFANYENGKVIFNGRTTRYCRRNDERVYP